MDEVPLALALAGAYLAKVTTRCSDYRRLYKESLKTHLESSSGLSSFKDRTALAIWKISYNHVIKDQNNFSAQSQVELTEDSDSNFSVASLESSRASTMASPATSTSDIVPINRDSAMEIVNVILKDPQLRDLLDKSFELLQPEKVTRNFRRALRSFSQDLMLEAKTPTQELAAKFLGQRSRQISALLREQIHPSASLDLPDHNVDILREERLRKFLRGLQPDFTQGSLQQAEEQLVDEDSEQDEYGDPDDRPDLSRMREWLLTANAMQNLRDRFRSFLYPEKEIIVVEPRVKANVDSPGTLKAPGKVQSLPEEEHQIVLEDKDKIDEGDPLTESTPNQISTVLPNLGAYKDVRDSFGPGRVRLEWTCVGAFLHNTELIYLQISTEPLQICGHTSYDDFRELRSGAVATYAEKLRKSGYVTHAQPTTTKSGIPRTFMTAVGNKVIAVSRSISTLKSDNKGGNVKPKARKFATIQCSPTPDVTCRWLHLCIKKRPSDNVTKLEPLHICKDEEERELKDAGLFKLLHKTWKTQRTWTDLILFKLKRIEFIKVRQHMGTVSRSLLLNTTSFRRSQTTQ